MEEQNRKYFKENPDYSLPYPHLDDMALQKKITLKQEFRYKYDGEISNVEEKSKIVCKKTKKHELFPHQEFIKRYISYDTPYNGILLYHGLGSGKTCSAIGITETLRTYSKYIQNFKKIMIVASPNVQENFKLQLFNPNNLVKENNIWNITGCVGNSFIHELNIFQINELEKDVLIQKINKIISNHYIFTGYIEFANYIEKFLKSKNKHVIQKNLKSLFEGRVVVIDEIHNIRLTSDMDKDKKKVANMLKVLVEYVKYIRFIFLTGTPMYNDPREILFILNILNMNDNRSTLSIKDVFDANGNFKIDPVTKEEIGKKRLMIKANGYISYVRGENPYSFPFLVTPHMYNDPLSIKKIKKYPSLQFNNNRIKQGISHLDLYLHKISKSQEEGYEYFINQITEGYSQEELEKFEEMDSVRYTMVMKPILSLNIVYKDKDKFLVGKDGLKNIMKFKESANPPSKNNFEYKKEENMGMFSYDKIGEYSIKIKSVLDHIINSNGIILVYSQYIDGGLIPMALALEELGMKRYMPGKNLFKEKRNDPLNVYNLKRDPKLNGEDFKQATYAIICGDKRISPNNKEEVEALTHYNMNGERVKVVLISQAGSEGIDLNYLRQVHILEPWYNMNRIEQIIGRARRNCSHKDLPLKERNVQVFLHATLLDNDIEAIDMYLYRNSEKKSIKIGHVSRVLKSVAVDCLLNKEQQNFAKMKEVININLSNSKQIDYHVKDEPFTSLCDYMDTCEYECINKLKDIEQIDKSTYSYGFTQNSKIIDKIKLLFTIKHVYHEKEFLNLLKDKTSTPIEIQRAIYEMLNDSQNVLIDKFSRKGTLININGLYLFQPIEIKDVRVTMHERINPITYKPKMVEIETKRKKENENERERKNENENENETETEGNETYPIITKIKEYYERAKASANTEDWYDCYYSAIELLKVDISSKQKEKYLIYHICESLTFEEDLELINYIWSKDKDESDKLDKIEKRIKKYYNQFIVNNDDVTGIILMNNKIKDIIQIYVLNENKFAIATYEERSILSKEITKMMNDDYSNFKWIGYMGYYKNIFDFKVINTTIDKISGSIFENKGRTEMLKIINETIEEKNTYNKSNTESLKKVHLCIIEEIYLRYYDEIYEGETRYFLNKLEVYNFNKKLR